MNIRNRKVYTNTDLKDDFWYEHYIWSFDFYITKRWRYTTYLKLEKYVETKESSLCYICERELKEIHYLTDYYKQVCIGKCCLKRYNNTYNTYNTLKKTIKKRFKLKEE